MDETRRDPMFGILPSTDRDGEPASGGRSPLDAGIPAAASPERPRMIYGGGEPPDSRDLFTRARDLLVRNNPLYLLSVLLMFLGLFLASEAGEDNTALATALAFYGVQVFYEAVLLAMALFLAGRLIDRRHGLLLLFFLLLFACDATFYQVRIASLASIGGAAWVARIVGLFALAFCAAKLALVHRLLGVKPRPDVIAFALAAVALISFAPQFLYARVEASGGGAGSFTGHWELYLLWLAAALITLPVVVRNLHASGYLGAVPNPKAGDENRIQWLLTLVPAVALPLQLHFNVNADALAANPALGSLDYCFVPYLVAAVFLAGALFHDAIEERIGLSAFDFIALLLVGALAALAQGTGSLLPGGAATREIVAKFGDVFFQPHRINLLLLLLAHGACAFVRGNRLCLAALSLFALAHFGDTARTGAQRAAETAGRVSRTAWAALLVTLSFLTLGLAFLGSLAARRPDGAPGARA